MNGQQFEEQYRDYLSDFHHWDQLPHANEWILFEDNLGTHLSLDETALSPGELYTVITNKAAKDRKGALVPMIKGTKSETVNQSWERYHLEKEQGYGSDA